MSSSRQVIIGNKLVMGGGAPIVVQTMCNTHTSDIEASVNQCRRLSKAGAQLIRLTVPTLKDVDNLRVIKETLRSEGIDTPLVADVHFSSEIAIAAAAVVEKVRINPGNFDKDFTRAGIQLSRLIDVCREHGTVLRIGLNHGSLGERITELYGNTALGMKEAAMEWLRLCADRGFEDIVVSLKASNTIVMIEAYRLLDAQMKKEDFGCPIHIGVTEAGNSDSGRIKSAVAIASLLREGIGDTIRVSLTEDPVNEIPVARYLAGDHLALSGHEKDIVDAAVKYGPALILDGEDTLELPDKALADEILQSCRKKFSHPEYVACPGCGRTMYDLQAAFEQVKARTSHLKGICIAVMGCIVNGPGEMADADWGYVGEGGGKVTIYKKKTPVLKHIPQAEAVDRLLELIESEVRQ